MPGDPAWKPASEPLVVYERMKDGSVRRVRLDPESEAALCARLADIGAGATIELGSEELAQWEATRDLPRSVEARPAAITKLESDAAWQAWVDRGPQGPIEDDGESFPS